MQQFIFDNRIIIRGTFDEVSKHLKQLGHDYSTVKKLIDVKLRPIKED